MDELAPRRAGRGSGAGRILVAAVLCLAIIPASEALGVDGVEARRQAYLCSSLQKDPAITACRRALELGLSRERAATAYLSLALNLSELNRWPEVVDAYRGRVRLRPEDAEAHWRLGDALLFGLSEPKEALIPLREAVRLKPDLVGAHGSLGVALASSGEYAQAVASLDEAVRLDPAYFTNRPAARQVYEAARKGERWEH
jgi:tetratricopeptide (TPR) repeat protein